MFKLTRLPESAERVIKNILHYLNEELWVKGLGMDEQKKEYLENKLSLVDLIDMAHREWEEARALFEEVKEPELVDHAIYAMEAAERKYVYLLKIAKKEKIVEKSTYQMQENELA